jgi:hypothetical protein
MIKITANNKYLFTLYQAGSNFTTGKDVLILMTCEENKSV